MTFLCLISSLPRILCVVQLMGVEFLKRDTAQRVAFETQCSAFGNNITEISLAGDTAIFTVTASPHVVNFYRTILN